MRSFNKPNRPKHSVNSGYSRRIKGWAFIYRSSKSENTKVLSEWNVVCCKYTIKRYGYQKYKGVVKEC